MNMKKRELILFLTALSTRVLCAFVAGDRNSDLDEVGYALNFLHGNGLVLEWACGIKRYSYWPPGFPVILAGYIKIFGQSWIYFRLFMAVFGALICLSLYRLARRMVGESFALTAGFWLAIYPPQIFWSTRMNPRSIASDLLVLIPWVAIDCREIDKLRSSILGGAWGFLCLFRAEYFLGCFGMAAWIWLVVRKGKRRLATQAAFWLTFSLVMSPWIITNWKIHHRFVLATTLGDSFYMTFNPGYDYSGNVLFVNDQRLMKNLTGKTDMQINDYLMSQALAYIRSNPYVLPRTLLGNFLNFWRPYLHPKAVSGKENALYVASYLPVFLLFLRALFKIPWNSPPWVLVIGLIAYQCFAHLPFYALVNFREMIAPLLILTAAAGLPFWDLRSNSHSPSQNSST